MNKQRLNGDSTTVYKTQNMAIVQRQFAFTKKLTIIIRNRVFAFKATVCDTIPLVNCCKIIGHAGLWTTCLRVNVCQTLVYGGTNAAPVFPSSLSIWFQYYPWMTLLNFDERALPSSLQSTQGVYKRRHRPPCMKTIINVSAWTSNSQC